MRVAVTGVGGGVGQSIMKALTLSSLEVEIYPVDVQPLSACLYRGQRGTVLPPPEKPGALEQWAVWLAQERIDALIPGSDHDLISLAGVRDDWLRQGVCQVLISDPELVAACQDKALTSELLGGLGLPYPRSAWSLSLDQALAWAGGQGYPLILKPRRGSGSRQLHLVQDEEELRFYFPRTKEPILQEHLGDGDAQEEFTCAVFADAAGQCQGTFMARRQLMAGATYQAEIGYWPQIDELLLELGRRLRPRGPLNVQLRSTPRGPVPFELNIRCSGTTAIRAYFGFNEPEMLLRHYVLGEPLAAPARRTGYAFRYWNEVFLEGVDGQRLRQGPQGIAGVILPWP